MRLWPVGDVAGMWRGVRLGIGNVIRRVRRAGTGGGRGFAFCSFVFARAVLNCARPVTELLNRGYCSAVGRRRGLLRGLFALLPGRPVMLLFSRLSYTAEPG